MESTQAKEYLTLTEVAQKLGVSDETIRRWLVKGNLKGYHFGKPWRVRPHDLAALINMTRFSIN